MPPKAQPATTVRKTRKRKAESTRSGRKDAKNKKTKLGYRVAVVIFMKEMEKYEDLKTKAERAGCLIVHEDQYCCSFTYEIPPDLEDPLAGDHKVGSIDVNVSAMNGPAYEHDVSAGALHEVEETVHEEYESPSESEAV